MLKLQISLIILRHFWYMRIKIYLNKCSEPYYSRQLWVKASQNMQLNRFYM